MKTDSNPIALETTADSNPITLEASSSSNPITLSVVTVICPKHGAHEFAIVSDIPGHEGAWCQLCWLESLGPSAPYRKRPATKTDSD